MPSTIIDIELLEPIEHPSLKFVRSIIHSELKKFCKNILINDPISELHFRTERGIYETNMMKKLRRRCIIATDVNIKIRPGLDKSTYALYLKLKLSMSNFLPLTKKPQLVDNITIENTLVN